MSAGASGSILSFNVIAPTSADLDDFEFGRRVYQVNSRLYSAQPQFSDWYISGNVITDPILITPLKARYINHSRVVNARRFREDFIVKPRII